MANKARAKNHQIKATTLAPANQKIFVQLAWAYMRSKAKNKFNLDITLAKQTINIKSINFRLKLHRHQTNLYSYPQRFRRHPLQKDKPAHGK